MAKHHCPQGGRRRRNFSNPGGARPSTRTTRGLNGSPGRVPGCGLAPTSDAALKRATAKARKKARALMAQFPRMTMDIAMVAAMGYSVDWSLFIDREGNAIPAAQAHN